MDPPTLLAPPLRLLLIGAFLALGAPTLARAGRSTRAQHETVAPGVSSAEKAFYARQAEAAHARMLHSVLNSTAGSDMAWQPTDNATQSASSRRSLQQSCINKRWMDFTQSKTPPGFFVEYGSATADQEGLRLNSWYPRGTRSQPQNTRMYYDNVVRNSPYLFNTNERPYTHLMVWFRGAPDNGKNSAVYLIQPRSNLGVNAPEHGVQDGSRDEIDFVEMYGLSGIAEYNLFSRGKMPGGAPWNHNALRPGYTSFMYEVFLVKGRYMKIQCLDPNTRAVLSVKSDFPSNLVPTNPMRLYASIWDCYWTSGDPKKCGRQFGSTSWMSLRGMWLDTCNAF